MVMDDSGAIYFLLKDDYFCHPAKLHVMRTNPQVEMGDKGFIETVYSVASSKAYFFLFQNGLFYLMDEKK